MCITTKIIRNEALEQEVRANVLQKMIAAGLPRLKEYRKQLRNLLQKLRENEDLMKNLKEVSRNTVKLLHEEISRPDPDFPITDIKSRGGEKMIELGSTIHHYAGRVGALFSYSKALVRAALLPQNVNLFDNLEIISLPAPDISFYPIFDGKIPDGNGIIGRMTSQEALQAELKALYAEITTTFRYLEFPEGLSTNLMSFSKKGRRVHAELQIVEYFRTPQPGIGKPQFWIQGDHFIGCSKPACYLCDLYVKAIPDKFELYGTHQKIYIAWRAPDIRSNPSQADIRAMKDIFNKMAGPVRVEVQGILRKKQPNRMKQMDSSIGVSDVPRTVETITSGKLNLPRAYHFTSLSYPNHALTQRP
ncbi:hypothetical protein EX30DRAFT_9525 [Ascodesmis nigricans]|uniref:Uncharacterized protein n=1 Tax=Ascodesmis nigricans TaxID=341454 RepID=A0A4S2N679_9PEZI|nr:hypothetical protein EX30DRAFT_9525 [Ascodesmis nigricans]